MRAVPRRLIASAVPRKSSTERDAGTSEFCSAPLTVERSNELGKMVCDPAHLSFEGGR